MRTIEVVDYRPEWEKMFQEEAKKIQKILEKNCIAIYHIGSTSVKGLAAKPIIDIMPVVRDISLVDAHDPEFRALGYDCRGEFGIPGRRFYAKGGDERTHHIHIFEKSNAAAVNRHLAVRDYLRSHPDTAREYAELKKQLAARYPHDNDGYCDGKEAYMKELEQKALKWQEEQDAQGPSSPWASASACASGPRWACSSTTWHSGSLSASLSASALDWALSAALQSLVNDAPHDILRKLAAHITVYISIPVDHECRREC